MRILTLILVSVGLIAACERPVPLVSLDGDTSQVETEQIAQGTSVDWRELISLDPDEFHARLGGPDCRRNEWFPSYPAPENRQGTLGIYLSACDYSGEDIRVGDLVVDRVKWIKGKPSIMWLSPTGVVPIGEAHEQLNLPAPDHKRLWENEGEWGKVASVLSPEGSGPEWVIEFLTSNSENLHIVKLYLGPGMGRWSGYDPLYQVPAGFSPVELSATSHYQPTGLIVRLGQNQVHYGICRASQWCMSWRVQEGTTPLFDAKKFRELLTDPYEIYYSLVVFPEMLTEASEISGTMRAAKEFGLDRVFLVGKGPATQGEFFDLYAVTVYLGTPRKLPLNVIVRPDGFDLGLDRTIYPPMEGCSNGPTLCKIGDEYDWDRLAEFVDGEPIPIRYYLSDGAPVQALYRAISLAGSNDVYWFDPAELEVRR